MNRHGAIPVATAAAAATVTIAGMIATPLAERGGPVRRALSSVVVGGLWATTASVAARRWGVRRASASAMVIGVGTALAERVGTATGVPFGRYAYTGALRPQVDGVPVIVPLAWFAMALPARDSAHAALGVRSTPWRRAVVGSAALTAWDLFLDPQMVGEGYWRWRRRGHYRGIPLTNFAGWFLVGLGVMAVLERTVPPDEPDPALVGTYATMAAMETLGFAAFFRDRLVAAVGGAAMVPVATAAVGSLVRRHR
jgi:uncharacterized membrane protein